MPAADSDSPHTYTFSEGILTFAPRGAVLPQHASQLVALLRRYSQPDRPLPCLFDLRHAPEPTPEARRLIVQYLRSEKPRLCIATHGAPLRLRAMLALVSAAARVVGGYDLQVTHCEDEGEARQSLRQLVGG